jgi:hypothetical protein
VNFGLRTEAVDQLTLDFIQTSEADEVLKRFASLVAK